MSTPVLILGESGTGKSISLRNMDPSQTLLIQAIKKPLPFKLGEGWKRYEEGKGGNIFVTDKPDEIIALMKGTKKKKIVLDDFQYTLSNELMRRWREKSYDKFSEIGFNGWNIFTVASTLPDDVHVFVLAHTMSDEDGIIKIKTPGKLLSTYSIEGMFSVVLRTAVRDGSYFFATKNSGNDTVKSPPGMFAEELIENDLAEVDKAISAFGW
jgi:hypothetical protein